MGATQSIAGGSGPSSSSSKPDPLGPGTNQAAVAALIRHRMAQGLAPPDVYRPNYVTLFEDKRFASSAGPSRTAAAPSPPSASGSSATPPPACPMHDPSASKGMSGGSSNPFASSSKQGSSSSSAADAGSSGSSSLLSKINPLNMMPELSQAPVSQDQTAQLSTERTISSIPRAPTSAAPGASPYDQPSACPVPHETRQAMAGGAADGAKEASPAKGDGNWEYPSAQQFYNALVRKGWETPEEHVDMMVLVHNFLNERAWREVCEWEKSMGVDPSQISLARFQGRPGTLSPKARLFSWLGVVAPSRFSSDPPFDRHDWVVRRPPAANASPDAPPKDIRYVIDYYQEPDDPTTEEPVFFLDVRPALDSFEAVQARIKVGLEEFKKDGFAGFKPQEDKKEDAATA